MTISQGLSSVALDVAPIDDTLIEGDETVILSAVPRSYYQVSHTTNAVVIIKDNDFVTTNPPPVVIITAPHPQASEGGTNAGAFRVSRTGSTNEWLEVFYQLFGSAQNGVDYQFLSNHVELPAGRSFVDIPVRPIDDDLVEGTESVAANLMPPPFASPVEPYRIGFPSNAVVTIEDHDAPGTNLPTVTAAALFPNVQEAATSTNSFGRFYISRTGPTNSALTVHLSTEGSATPDVDYHRLPDSVTLAPGR